MSSHAPAPGNGKKSRNADRVPALISDLSEIVARVVAAQLAVDAGKAQEIGMQASREFCREFKGELIYLPGGRLLDIDDRDREMYTWFCRNGRDYVATHRHFGLGLQWVYRRIKTIESTAYNRRQMGLFPGAGDEETDDV